MIERRQREVFYSPRRRRHFMTAIAAARAEANTRLRRWFPPEAAEHDVGYFGWSWNEEPRLVAVHKRLVERYMKELESRP